MTVSVTKKSILIISALLVLFAVLTGCSKADTAKGSDPLSGSEQNDRFDGESGIKSERTEDGKYVLELTDKQATNFSEAECYLMQRAGKDAYFPVFNKIGVTKDGNKLVSDFNGKVFYMENSFGERCIPFIRGVEKTEEYTIYSIPVFASSFYSFDDPDDNKSMNPMYYIAINNKTDEMDICVLSETDEISSEAFIAGEYTDIDLSEYPVHGFSSSNMYYMLRDETKTIKTADSWIAENRFLNYEFYAAEGCDVVYAPVSEGDLYLVFEIKNKDGSGYCAEPIAVEPVEHAVSFPEEKPVSVKWESGESVSLGEYGGVEISIKFVEDWFDGKKYTVSCTNNNDFAVRADINDVFVNGNIYCPDADFGIIVLEPGEIYDNEFGIDLGNAATVGAFDKLSLLDFSVTLKNNSTYERIVFSQRISVEIADAVSSQVSFDPKVIDWPSRGVLAEPDQVIYDEDGVKVALVGLGGEIGKEGNINILLKLENTTEIEKYFAAEQLCLDGVGLNLNRYKTVTELKPNSVAYDYIKYDSRELDELGIYSAENVKLLLRFSQNEKGSFASFAECDIKLSDMGVAQPFVEGDEIIFEEKGVRISVLHSYNDPGAIVWELAVVNESDTDYCVDIYDYLENGEFKWKSIENNMVCAGVKTVAQITSYSSEELDSVSFKVRLMDLNSESILYMSDTEIVLAVPEENQQ